MTQLTYTSSTNLTLIAVGCDFYPIVNYVGVKFSRFFLQKLNQNRLNGIEIVRWLRFAKLFFVPLS